MIKVTCNRHEKLLITTRRILSLSEQGGLLLNLSRRIIIDLLIPDFLQPWVKPLSLGHDD